MAWKPFFPEGITQVQRADILALHCYDTWQVAGSLGDMADDWKFFSVGCIYTYGNLDYDIISEFTQTHADKDCAVMTLYASNPIFSGMCPPGWPDPDRKIEHELRAIPVEYWDEMRDHIAGVGLVDRRRSRYAQATVVPDLEIVDFLALKKPAAGPRPPTVKITAFGIDGTHHRVGFASRTTGPRDTAAVVKLPIRTETVRVGRAILTGDFRPLAASLEVRPEPAIPDPVDISLFPAAKQREYREAIERAKKEMP
jgi:hypothetical protein